jgi:hypothetical protein
MPLHTLGERSLNWVGEEKSTNRLGGKILVVGHDSLGTGSQSKLVGSILNEKGPPERTSVPKRYSEKR